MPWTPWTHMDSRSVGQKLFVIIVPCVDKPLRGPKTLRERERCVNVNVRLCFLAVTILDGDDINIGFRSLMST